MDDPKCTVMVEIPKFYYMSSEEMITVRSELTAISEPFFEKYGYSTIVSCCGVNYEINSIYIKRNGNYLWTKCDDLESPEIGLSEDYISRTQLGRYDTKEYSSSYSAMKDSHRFIEYTWGTYNQPGFFRAKVVSGKVSNISYFKNGHVVTEYK